MVGKPMNNSRCGSQTCRYDFYTSLPGMLAFPEISD